MMWDQACDTIDVLISCSRDLLKMVYYWSKPNYFLPPSKMDNREPKPSLELHFTEILGFHFWKRVNTNEKLRKWVFCHGLSRFDHVMRSDAHEPYLTPSSIVEGLKDHQFSHFVCHGHLEPGQPFDAPFQLLKASSLEYSTLCDLDFPQPSLPSSQHVTQLSLPRKASLTRHSTLQRQCNIAVTEVL
jgi:hypothetical protein